MGWFDWLTSFWDKGPPSHDKFAQMFLAELRKVGEQRPLKFESPQFRILIGEKNDGMISLGNFYAEYCALPQEKRGEYLTRVARISHSLDDNSSTSVEVAREHLRPKVWLSASLAFTALQAQIDDPNGKGLGTPQYEIGSHLVASIVYDTADAMRSISDTDLEGWGLTYYEALEIARENLEKQPFQFAKIGDGLYASTTGDCYDASRLLLPGFLDQLEVRGDLVALAANRDTLLLTGTDDVEGLEGMLAIATEAQQQPRPMAFIPIRRDGEDWFDWLPPANHKLHHPFKEMAIRFLYGLYEEQQGLLQTWCEKRQKDIFVASYSAIQQKDTQQILTYSVWSEGITTLLPKTEFLCLVASGDNPDEPKPLGFVRWNDVLGVAEDLLQPTDYYPPRFLVKEFPTAAMITQWEFREL